MVLEGDFSFRVCSKGWVILHIAVCNFLFESWCIYTVLKGYFVVEPKCYLAVLLFDFAFVPLTVRVWF